MQSNLELLERRAESESPCPIYKTNMLNIGLT